jgi:negative regulator of sigma E activity
MGTFQNFSRQNQSKAEGVPHRGRKYYCARFIIHIDKELPLPVRNVFYDEKDEMFEDYAFTDVKLNVGLTATDFSRHNKPYQF